MSVRVDGSVVLPFEKHKGERVEDVDSDYLEWLWENAEIRDNRLASAIHDRLVSEGRI